MIRIRKEVKDPRRRVKLSKMHWFSSRILKVEKSRFLQRKYCRRECLPFQFFFIAPIHLIILPCTLYRVSSRKVTTYHVMFPYLTETLHHSLHLSFQYYVHLWYIVSRNRIRLMYWLHPPLPRCELSYHIIFNVP